MNTFLAGLLAALPISVLGLGYMLLSGRKFVAALQSADADIGTLPGDQPYYLFLAAFSLSPFFFAIPAAFVYTRTGSQQHFLGLTLGLAVLLSLLAIISKTPLTGFKIAANFIVALSFGLLLPLFAG